MKLAEKIDYLKCHFFSRWTHERQNQWNLLSSEHPYVCLCGKLATGFHEIHCYRFQKAVDKNTIKALEHLIPKQK